MSADEPSSLLGDATGVGLVRREGVRIWWRSTDQAHPRLTVTGDGASVTARPVEPAAEDSDWTGAADWPEGFTSEGGGRPPALRPGTAYRVTAGPGIDAHGDPLPFRTPGSANRSVTLMFASCHQPFGPGGQVRADSARMLEATADWARRREIDLILLSGDQIYTDLPEKSAPGRLANKRGPAGLGDAANVRALLHARYRRFFGVPGFARLLATAPCCMTLDDHELLNNWGASRDHRSSDWRGFRDGCLQAYQDYQGARVGVGRRAGLGPGFEVHGDGYAMFVCDLRTFRLQSEEHPLLGDEQARALRGFLERPADGRLSLVVVSVPLVHTPGRLTRWISRVLDGADEFSDRWESPLFVREQQNVLRWLQARRLRCPEDPLVVVGGDVHVGLLSTLRFQGGRETIPQVVSSGLSHRMPWWGRRLAAASFVDRSGAIAAGAGLESTDFALAPLHSGARAPWADLNFAALELRLDDARLSRARFALWGWTGHGIAEVGALDVRH